MDINGPGTSLFQGNELSNFDNLEQREEEEEALEEQRRRELELKSELENAFDDVSFDNDEESIYNGNENRLSSAHTALIQNNLHSELVPVFFEETAHNRRSNGGDSPSCRTDGPNTPLKHSVRNIQGKKIDLRNDYENFTDECRKKIQNGSLQDIVDQSGGGDQNIPTLLHYNHCFQRNSLGEAISNGMPNSNNFSNNSNNSNNLIKGKYSEEAEDSTEQLRVLYDVRVREVHKLTELIDTLRNEHETEMSDIKHQMALLLAEKERTTISHQQLQNLLVTYKQQIEHLVGNVNELEMAKKELETSKQELITELDSAKIIIDDLQRKIIVLEKGSRSKIEIEQFELNLKSQLDKNNLEIMNLRKELENVTRNYETVSKENDELKLKIINLSQINDENLAKKSEIITRLSQQIEETQSQFENIMKLSLNEGNFRLQAELKLLKEEKSQLVSKIENLEREKSRQEEDLKQFESLSKMSFLSRDSGNNSESKEFDGSEVSGKLGAELFRALNSQKAKRLEIQNLQSQLDEKNKQISILNENEKNLNWKIESLKGEINKCLNNLTEKEKKILEKAEENKKMEKELNEIYEKSKTSECEMEKKCVFLENEAKVLREKVRELEKEKEETINNYSEEYVRFHDEGLEKVRKETEEYYKMEMLKKDVENESLKKEIDELKNLYVEVCTAKENCQQAERERKSPRHGGIAVDMEEVKKLQKELEKSRHRILELDQTLKQQYEQEVEILNLDINQLKLQLEKLKREKDRETAEKDKLSVENELLKTEVEQITSEKNLLFLDYEKLLKEAEDVRLSEEKISESSKVEMKKLLEKHSLEMQNLSNKYEITIKKLKKEIELTVTKAVKMESKYTSPIKNGSSSRNAALQACSVVPAEKTVGDSAHEASGAPLFRDRSVSTDPEPAAIPKREVVEMMEKLGAHHEEEILALEKKYCADLLKLEKKFHSEVDKAKEVIRRELEKENHLRVEQLEEKHRIEMMNRIEQEKKEAVVDLITEWACEVQSLKVSYAESQAEMEKMKMKYKAAKSVAMQYKTYFKSKAEHMKEEWKKIEEGYEKALKELEKNVHILVDVKEDEVKAKVDSITKLYEEKINKMRKKLCKFEEKLKTEKETGNRTGEDGKMESERLSVPDGDLFKNFQGLEKKKMATPRKSEESNDSLRKKSEKTNSHKKKCEKVLESKNEREKTKR